MKLEKNNESMLFSSTNIPDVFFTEYLSLASGDFIKVYLYLIFLSKYDKDIKLNDLSKKLALDFKTIQEALKFWEELGIIVKKPTGYIISNLQEIELQKLYSPKLTSSPEDIKKNAKNQYRAKAIENINNQYFQGLMPLSLYTDIDLWFNKYGFDEQVMMALFNYCYEKSALHKNYIQAVADAWSKNNIKTFTDLDSYFEKQEKLNTIKKSISKKLRYPRPFNEYEEAYITKWVVDYGYSFEIIELALKRTTSKANVGFDYLDKIISDWKERNLRTVNDIQNYTNNLKQKEKDVKALEKKTNYNNHEQRNYDNFDNFYANIKK